MALMNIKIILIMQEVHLTWKCQVTWEEADSLYRRLVEVSENGAKNIII